MYAYLAPSAPTPLCACCSVRCNKMSFPARISYNLTCVSVSCTLCEGPWAPPSHTHARTHTHTNTQKHTLSLTHAHTHTHTHAHTHTHTHADTDAYVVNERHMAVSVDIWQCQSSTTPVKTCPISIDIFAQKTHSETNEKSRSRTPPPTYTHTQTLTHKHTTTHTHTHTTHTITCGKKMVKPGGQNRGSPPPYTYTHTHTRTRTHTRTQTHKDLGEVRDETKWPRARTGLPAPAAEVNNWRERNRGPKLVLSCNPAFPAQDIIFFSITSSIVTRKPQT